MTKPSIAINTRSTEYGKLIALGGTVRDHLSSNPYFTNPYPSVADLNEAINDTSAALAEWAPTGNYGSRQALTNVRIKANTLARTIKSMAQYVENTALQTAGGDYELMTVILSSSGFTLKRAKAPQGIIADVYGFCFKRPAGFNQNKIKLKWKKPLGLTCYINVKAYRVYVSTTERFSDATLLNTVTKTSCIYINNTGAAVRRFFWVIPVGAAGDGVTSQGLAVDILGIS